MSEIEDWTGLTSHRHEPITTRQIEHFRATFGQALFAAPVPPGLHWCLVPDIAGAWDLGRDGHPRHGIHVPKLRLPRRMWAGGELLIEGAFGAGDRVERDSTVEKIAFKTGSSGELAFLTMRHVWSVGGEVKLRERQDIVYREEAGSSPFVTPPLAEAWNTLAAEPFDSDPVLLFRYSALTFNGHRIHYDEPYARNVEGYSGLVVHGPMQATLMLNLAARIRGGQPSRFAYRGLAPMICGTPARLEAKASEVGLSLRVITAEGVTTMSAEAEF